jgi:MFS family permease
MTTSASASSDTVALHWRRNQSAVTIATFVGFTGFTLAMPFLPLYFQQLGVQDTGALAIWSGVSLGITPAITAMMAPAWSRVAERHGRKLMVERSLLAFVIVMALLAAVRAPWQVLALRALLGFFAGYGPIAITMAAESAPPEHMAMAIGWVQTAQRLGPTLGPVLGGLLAAYVGLRQTFLVAAVLYLGALVLVFVGYREEGLRAPAAPGRAARPPTWAAVRALPHFVLFLGIIFACSSPIAASAPCSRCTGRSAPPDHIAYVGGSLFTITAGAAALGHHLAGKLLKRWRPSQIVAPAVAAASLGAVIFGFGPPTQVLLATSVVFGLGIGLATTTVYTAAGRAAPVSDRGVAFGYLTTAYLTALATSPVVAGLIGAHSMRAVFFLDAVGLAAIAVLVRRRIP